MGESNGNSNSRKGRFKRWVVSSKAAMSMFLVQIFATVMLLLSKVVLNNGTFVFALMTYRHLVAALCVAPFAFFFERDIRRYIRWSLFFWLFLNAFTGITAAMGLYYYGIRDTTATYAANFLNLIPIFTFVFSIITRIEKLGVNSRAGKIKILGAILCVGGALTIGLYKGKSFHILNHSIERHRHDHIVILTNYTHWTRGSFMLIASCLCYATWYILQVKVIKVLPLKYWATMLTCLIAAMQSAVFGLSLNRRKEVWRLSWDLQLLTIFYSGAFATAATFCLVSWTVSKQGPTYPSMFNPLSLVLVALLEALLLGAYIRLGTLVGMVMIIVGLYSFLLGKRKAMKGVVSQIMCHDLEVVEVAVIPVNDDSTVTVIQTSNISNDDIDVADTTTR